MKTLLALLIITARPSAAYRIENAAAPAGAPAIYVQVLADARPETEITGAQAGFNNRATKDSMFADSVTTAVTWALADELKVHGLDARVLGPGEIPPVGSTVLTGEIRSYTSRMITPRTAMIPYVSWVTWLWSKDKIAGEVEVRVNLSRPGQAMWQETFKASEDTQAWVGPLHLSERGRSITRREMVIMLHEAAKNVLGRAAGRTADALGVPPRNR